MPTTSTKTTPKAAEPDVAPSPLAQDLRALADIAATSPVLANLIGTPGGPHFVAVVLPRVSPVTAADFALALDLAGAREIDAEQLDPAWPTRSWLLPGKTVAFSVMQLRDPA